MSANIQAGTRSSTRCSSCSSPLEAGARFCGDCGASMHRPQAAQTTYSGPSGGEQAPAFARAKTKNTASPAQTRELGSLLVLLARERLFLIMHWCIFVTLSLIGFGLAMKCYTEFHGDDMSKLMMAITPMMFINLSALVCLTPIAGTKREIERVQERIAYLKFEMRFKHLI